jgi:hypothetical protein
VFGNTFESRYSPTTAAHNNKQNHKQQQQQFTVDPSLLQGPDPTLAQELSVEDAFMGDGALFPISMDMETGVNDADADADDFDEEKRVGVAAPIAAHSSRHRQQALDESPSEIDLDSQFGDSLADSIFSAGISPHTVTATRTHRASTVAGVMSVPPPTSASSRKSAVSIKSGQFTTTADDNNAADGSSGGGGVARSFPGTSSAMIMAMAATKITGSPMGRGLSNESLGSSSIDPIDAAGHMVDQ